MWWWKGPSCPLLKLSSRAAPQLSIESLIRRNIIRRRFFYGYSQNFWAAEISSYTVVCFYVNVHKHFLSMNNAMGKSQGRGIV